MTLVSMQQQQQQTVLLLLLLLLLVRVVRHPSLLCREVPLLRGR
jgi:hypothetical protein